MVLKLSCFNGTTEISLQDIKKSIPKRCFDKNEFKFLLSTFRALFLSAICTIIGFYIPLTPVFIPVWIVYAIITGTVYTGVWVIAHECGHGSFSSSRFLCDLLGYPLHTALLVPYFSWAWSHHVHHMNLNHIDNGETWVPQKKSDPSSKLTVKFHNLVGDDAFSIFEFVTMATIGWPLYLIFGYTGGSSRGFTSHFILPNKLMDPIFVKAVLSIVGIVAMFIALYEWTQATSFYTVLAMYVGPYMVVNFWLVMYTYLHHTDENVHHYDDRTWTWLKGAFCSIDRNYPSYINWLHFQIGSTHVCHHLFSDMPHYNALEATEYIKKIAGDLYLEDKTPWYKAYYNASKYVKVVEDNGEGVWKYLRTVEKQKKAS